MLSKTILLVIMGFVVVLGGRCPPPEVVEPCTCSESSHKLICIKYNSNDFNSTYNLTHIFDNISQNLISEDQPFKQLMIANTQSLSFEENLFGNITFEELFILENNLTKIHSNIFEKTYSVVKKVYMNLNSVKDSPQNYSLFQALSALESLEVLELDFGINSITSIPDNAFTPVNGIQNNLREVSINGRIQTVGELAFAQLPALRKLRVLNELKTIGSHSFEYTDTSEDELQLDLSFNGLSAQGFEMNCFSNMKRPVNLILTENNIKYLEETVFQYFMDANKYNKLVLTKNPLNCTDCRSYWVSQQKSNLKNRIIDPICSYGNSVWDHNWKCSNGSSYLSVKHSLFLSLFLIIKVILI